MNQLVGLDLVPALGATLAVPILAEICRVQSLLPVLSHTTQVVAVSTNFSVSVGSMAPIKAPEGLHHDTTPALGSAAMVLWLQS